MSAFSHLFIGKIINIFLYVFLGEFVVFNLGISLPIFVVVHGMGGCWVPFVLLLLCFVFCNFSLC